MRVLYFLFLVCALLVSSVVSQSSNAPGQLAKAGGATQLPTTTAPGSGTTSTGSTSSSGSTGLLPYEVYPYTYTGLPRNDTGPLCPDAAPPDVVLNVPNLSVQKILLNVNQLNAKLALTASALGLVSLNAGVNVTIGDVNLQIVGVAAALRLEVRLKSVTQIVDRVLSAIDLNPIIAELGSGLGSTLSTVGSTAGSTVAGVGSAVGTSGVGSTVGSTVGGVTGAVASTVPSALGTVATAAVKAK